MSGKFEAVQTGWSCPEVWRFYDEDLRLVGCTHLRYGVFRAHAGHEEGPVVFERDFTSDAPGQEPEERDLWGDHFADGYFQTQEARDVYLRIAARKIAEHRREDADGYMPIVVLPCDPLPVRRI